ncbi:MAG: copper chaperone PCu(A)C, partial [Proteobacteria bacterium]|nr:copper chaperone PCu(A)C [Pseudomonadota bacterium]
MRAARAWALALSLAGATAAAGAADIEVESAWLRPTPPGATVAAAYLVVHNRGDRPDRLEGAAAARAARVELHRSA